MRRQIGSSGRRRRPGSFRLENAAQYCHAGAAHGCLGERTPRSWEIHARHRVGGSSRATAAEQGRHQGDPCGRARRRSTARPNPARLESQTRSRGQRDDVGVAQPIGSRGCLGELVARRRTGTGRCWAASAGIAGAAEVWCEAPMPLLRERFAQRWTSSHRIHGAAPDDDEWAQMVEHAEPLGLGARTPHGYVRPCRSCSRHRVVPLPRVGDRDIARSRAGCPHLGRVRLTMFEVHLCRVRVDSELLRPCS